MLAHKFVVRFHRPWSLHETARAEATRVLPLNATCEQPYLRGCPPKFFASKNMTMNVENGLTCIWPGVEHKAELAIGMFGSDLISKAHHFGKKFWVGPGHLRDITIVLLRNNERVQRRLWIEVTERDDSG